MNSCTKTSHGRITFSERIYRSKNDYSALSVFILARFLSASLKRAGIVCYTAASHQEAIQSPVLTCSCWCVILCPTDLRGEAVG